MAWQAFLTLTKLLQRLIGESAPVRYKLSNGSFSDHRSFVRVPQVYNRASSHSVFQIPEWQPQLIPAVLDSTKLALSGGIQTRLLA